MGSSFDPQDFFEYTGGSKMIEAGGIHVTHGGSENKIKRRVRTGGPCSGKTKIAPWLNVQIPLLGWHYRPVPEVAAFLIEKFGLPVKKAWQDKDMPLWLWCQRRIMTRQIEWETLADEIVEITGIFPALIDLDRALLDVYGYILDACYHFGNPGEALDIFVQILRETTGLTFEQALARYDLVHHMVTAADGAPRFYTLENNVARDESLERAIELDGRMWQAWERHVRRERIDNSTDFEGKQNRMLQLTCNALGIPLISVEK